MQHQDKHGWILIPFRPSEADTLRVTVSTHVVKMHFYLRSQCCTVLILTVFIIYCSTHSPSLDLLAIYLLLIGFY